jgi:hypothetical protein
MAKRRVVLNDPALTLMSQPVPGFVLAFPGASQAEGNDLIEMLRTMGRVVCRVDDETAGSVLRRMWPVQDAPLGLDNPPKT